MIADEFVPNSRTTGAAIIIIRIITAATLAMGKMGLENFTIILLILATLNIDELFGDCPHVCECKWKSGKESVMCLNSNLTAIPNKLDTGTQVIDLTGNDIVTIKHDAFNYAGLLNLQKIFIAKCRLKTIDRYAFRNLINLVELDLSYNVLNVIPSHIFDSISELRELKLNGNPIQRISNDAFINLPQLVRLELADCRVSAIEQRAFVAMESTLEWLNLEGNKLIDIQQSTIFTKFYNLKGLELARNPWNCSCKLRPIREWMIKMKIPYSLPPVCKSPLRLFNKSWDKLGLQEFACLPNVHTEAVAYGEEGKNITINCKIEGIPEPNVKWILKNKMIVNMTENLILPAKHGNKIYKINLHKTSTNLTILTADLQDTGTYICLAENKAGRVEAPISLMIRKNTVEKPSNIKFVIIVIICLVTLICILTLLSLTYYIYKRYLKKGNWKSANRTDSYEKIEMNHNNHNNCKDYQLSNNYNHSKNNKSKNLTANFNQTATTEIAFLGSFKSKYDYRNVPSEDDGTGLEDNTDFSTLGSITAKPKPLAAGGGAAGVAAKAATTAASTASSNNINIKTNSGNWNVNQILFQQNISSSDKFGGSDGSTGGMTEDMDLHIPRLDLRNDNIDKVYPSSKHLAKINDELSRCISSTSSSASNNNEPHINQHIMRKKILPGNNGSLYTSESLSPQHYEGSSFSNHQLSTSSFERKCPPDLLDLYNFNETSSALASVKNNTSSASSTMSNSFCTLPRKKGGGHNRKCFSVISDSQSPLLSEATNYLGASDSFNSGSTLMGSNNSNNFYKYNFDSSISSKQHRRSNSVINLSSTDKYSNKQNPSLPSSPVQNAPQHLMNKSLSPSATPLLDFTSFQPYCNNSIGVPPSNSIKSSYSNSSNTSNDNYDFHTSQLEKFLAEYRNLQEQLFKMKKTCDTIKQQDNVKLHTPSSTHTLAPLLFNSAAAALETPVQEQAAAVTTAAANNPKSILKHKKYIPGQPPDPPSYWLHRNAMLKQRFNNQDSNY